VNRGIYATTFDEDVPTDEQSRAQQTCPECDGRVTTNSHETVCESCGLVLDADHIDPGPEWRSFDDEHRRPERTGAPRTAARHDRGLSTRIGHSGVTTTGQQFSGRKRRQLSRLRREQRRAKVSSKRERNQVYAFTDIRRMVSALGLTTNDRDQACQLFRTAQEADLLRGRSLEAMSAAAVYAVCRITGQPQTLADIAPVARVEQSRVENAYGVLNRELQLPARPPEPTAYVPRLVSALELPAAVERRARALLDERADAIGVGASPPGVAGGAILVAATDCGERGRLTQSALADAAGVTPATLRTHRDALRRD
jgi:transcription initiation factor TFIIB